MGVGWAKNVHVRLRTTLYYVDVTFLHACTSMQCYVDVTFLHACYVVKSVVHMRSVLDSGTESISGSIATTCLSET